MKDDRVYLAHIRDAIHDIEQYTAGGRDAFMGDRMQQGAGMRDRLTHDYLSVDLSLGWIAVERDIPNLGSAVDALLT